MRAMSFQFVVTLLFLWCIPTAASAQPELDITFNGTGKVTTDLTAGADNGYAVIVQPDNKIVAAGATNFPNSPRNFALVRYNTDGSLDGSFGTGGKVITDFDANAPGQGAYALAQQPDGKLIAGGFAGAISSGPGYFALARYNTDGSPDTTFGTGGKVSTPVGQSFHYIQDIAIAPDGKIVAAGWFYHSSLHNWQTALVRYNADGSLDASFGSGGVVQTLMGNGSNDYNTTYAVAIQPDGKIVTGGSYYPFGSFMGFDITVRRYNTNGSLDNSFNGSGQLVVPSLNSEGVNALAILADGKILAAGSTGTSSVRDFFLLRLNADGSPDASFAGQGMITTSLGVWNVANAIFAQPNGKITVSGYTGTSAQAFAVACYNADGSLDTTFSGDGKLVFGFSGSSQSGGNALALDGLGRIVIAGFSNDMFAAARLYTRDPIPVSVSGRVVASDGRALKGAVVSLTDQSGAARTTVTSPFGYFQFGGVFTGQTYTVSAALKRFTFEEKAVGLNEELASVDFTGVPEIRGGRSDLNKK